MTWLWGRWFPRFNTNEYCGWPGRSDHLLHDRRNLYQHYHTSGVFDVYGSTGEFDKVIDPCWRRADLPGPSVHTMIEDAISDVPFSPPVFTIIATIMLGYVRSGRLFPLHQTDSAPRSTTNRRTSRETFHLFSW